MNKRLENFRRIKLLFQSGFDEGKLKSYILVSHANMMLSGLSIYSSFFI